MISHRNLIFSGSDSVSVSEETVNVYPVRCPYLLQMCNLKDNLQIVSCPENPCPFGSDTLVSCNGRTCLLVPAIHLPLHISRTPPLEC
jgi:hypothetical protein